MPLPFLNQPIKIASEFFQAKGRRKANEQMERLMREQPVYQVSPMLGLAQQQLQGRMAGAAQAEQNIYQQGANTQANINRAATDPMQAILGAGAIQGQTSQAFNQLAGQEQADYANRFNTLSNISTQERANQFEDELRRFGNKAQLQSMIQENKQINRAVPANLSQEMTDQNIKGLQTIMGLGGGNFLGGAAGKGAVQGATGYTPGMGSRGITPYTPTGNTGVYNMFQSQSPYSWMPNSSMSMGSGSNMPYSWMQGVRFGGNQ